ISKIVVGAGNRKTSVKSFPIPSHLMVPTVPLLTTASTINSEIFQCLMADTVIGNKTLKNLNLKNNQIEFVDGTILENIDVIYST
ncbi:19938_t:CDS:2, partial [Gigaspora rosea]